MHRDPSCRRFALGGLLVGFLSASTTLAQSVLPVPPNGGSVATAGTNVPFGRPSTSRVQIAYGEVSAGSAVVIEALGFVIGASAVTAKSVDLEVRLSTAANEPSALASDFAGNRGGDELIVRAQSPFALPAANPGDVVWIDLEQPYFFDPAGGALLIELVQHARAPGTYAVESTTLCTSTTRAVGPTACPGSSGELTVRMLNQGLVWGAPLVLAVDGADPGAPTGLFMGSRSSGFYSGLTLPIPLASAGAPGCYLAIDILWTLVGSADASGRSVHTLAVPPRPALSGQELFLQGVALDRGANALGLVTSSAVAVDVCGHDDVARVWAGEATATIGVVENGVAPRLQLRIR